MAFPITRIRRNLWHCSSESGAASAPLGAATAMTNDPPTQGRMIGGKKNPSAGLDRSVRLRSLKALPMGYAVIAATERQLPSSDSAHASLNPRIGPVGPQRRKERLSCPGARSWAIPALPTARAADLPYSTRLWKVTAAACSAMTAGRRTPIAVSREATCSAREARATPAACSETMPCSIRSPTFQSIAGALSPRAIDALSADNHLGRRYRHIGKTRSSQHR